MAGRPKSTVCVNLNKIEDSVDAFNELMDSDKNVQWKENKVKIKTFSEQLNFLTKDTGGESETEEVLDSLEKVNEKEIVYVVSNIWERICDRNKLALVFDFSKKLEHNLQCNLFSLFGNMFNNIIYEESVKELNKVKGSTVKDLIHVTKKEKYESIDKRLQCFIDEMTKKNGHRSTIHDNTNYKYNVLENIMKSRNNNYVSQIGISENIICHFGSNKCKHNTQV